MRYNRHMAIVPKYIPLFWRHVVKGENPSDCWGWNASCRAKGYGAFCWMSDSGQYMQDRAHRFSWILHKGEIPEDQCVLHTCDNPVCSNPEHLFLGTIAENNRDKCRKGRHVSGGTKAKREGRPVHYKKGEAHHNAKLTQKDVDEIRYLYNFSTMSVEDLSKSYNVGAGHICRIIRNKAWK